MANVLIVEDEQPLAKAYQTILEKNKHRVRVTYNGKEALAALEIKQPDLVLLDMKMPLMSGLDFLRHLNNEDHSVAVIVFTNQELQAEIDEAFHLGATRYVLKAWASPQDLIRIVNETLSAPRTA